MALAAELTFFLDSPIGVEAIACFFVKPIFLF
jgi:hypothetical protein